MEVTVTVKELIAAMDDAGDALSNGMTLDQRAAIYTRAAGYLLAEMADGAWARRGRWSECEARARREA